MTKSVNRLSQNQLPHQTDINPNNPIHFYFDGVRYQGLEGDTLASALLANGVKRIGRSFKLHRPRGFMAAGLEEPNGLVQLEKGSAFDEPNARATTIPLREGLVGHWPKCLALGELGSIWGIKFLSSTVSRFVLL